jgi:asparagine synthase (glutamine-hydrolysing)
MCGIIGYFSDGDPIDVKMFNRMRDKLEHRGPDGKNSVLLENDTIALGHRRLSIVDLSISASQPMTNSDSSIWLTFNGEIYNYQKIREELLKKKYIFKSKSDSEVLIHGYHEWGVEKLLDKIDGIFAFAIWDTKEDKLTIARDRFGVKPVYYYLENNKFIFASEPKAIIEDDKINFAIDKNALADFFIYSYVPSPESIYKNIKKLQPGHYLTYSNISKELKIEKYWEIKFDSNVIDDDFAKKKAANLIENSIKSNLIGDVPIGVFLSGGYDSTLLLQNITKFNNNVNSFTVGYKNLELSEHFLAREISSTFNSNHFETIIDENYDLFNILDEISYFYDEPFAYSSMIPYYIISKEAVKKNKVVLAGDGADEAFAGYKWYSQIYKYQKSLTFKTKIKHFLYGEKNILLDKYDSKMSNTYRFYIDNKILSRDSMNRINTRGLSAYNSNYLKNVNYMKRFQYLDLMTFLPESCLTRADRSSMANGLEVRVPYLSYKIFEFLYSLKTSVYYKNNIQKVLIRKNISKKISNDVLDAPKSGFSFKSISPSVQKVFDKLMKDSILKDLNIISFNFSHNKIPDNIKFQLSVLEFWFRKYYGKIRF